MWPCGRRTKEIPYGKIAWWRHPPNSERGRTCPFLPQEDLDAWSPFNLGQVREPFKSSGSKRWRRKSKPVVFFFLILNFDWWSFVCPHLRRCRTLMLGAWWAHSTSVLKVSVGMEAKPCGHRSSVCHAHIAGWWLAVVPSFEAGWELVQQVILWAGIMKDSRPEAPLHLVSIEHIPQASSQLRY